MPTATTCSHRARPRDRADVRSTARIQYRPKLQVGKSAPRRTIEHCGPGNEARKVGEMRVTPMKCSRCKMTFDRQTARSTCYPIRNAEPRVANPSPQRSAPISSTREHRCSSEGKHCFTVDAFHSGCTERREEDKEPRSCS